MSLHYSWAEVGEVVLAGQTLGAEHWRSILNSRLGAKLFNFTKELSFTGKTSDDKKSSILWSKVGL